MANTCIYTMKAVSENKEALERLVSIMKYKDPEYFIYRCFEAHSNIYKDGEYYVADISGDVAWSCSNWFGHEEKPDELIVLKYDENMKEIYGTSHYISLDLLCKKLGIGIEVFSEERECCFQEHYMVNSEGEITINERVEWIEDWWDEAITTHGFEYYCQFNYPCEIFG